MEKLDINEEIVRLGQHLSFFQQLREEEKSNGKQLQFLSQEMGREINTIGSKANDAEIQRLVVGMKNELEKNQRTSIEYCLMILLNLSQSRKVAKSQRC